MKKYHILRTFWHDNAEYKEGDIREFTDEQFKSLGKRRLELSDGTNKPSRRREDGEAEDVKIRRNKTKVKATVKDEAEDDEDDELEDEDLEDGEAEDEEDEDLEPSEKEAPVHPNKMIDKNSSKAKRK